MEYKFIANLQTKLEGKSLPTRIKEEMEGAVVDFPALAMNILNREDRIKL
jgi:hypothetical protein